MEIITALPADWYTEVEVPDVDRKLPGIYEWRIEGVGVYIGQYKSPRRPLRQYTRNVLRKLNGLSYRAGKPDGYRRIHLALADAYRPADSDAPKPRIELRLLANELDKSKRNRLEQDLIAERRRLAREPGGLPVLNGPVATTGPDTDDLPSART